MKKYWHLKNDEYVSRDDKMIKGTNWNWKDLENRGILLESPPYHKQNWFLALDK